ncbi:MAG: hypothetical protein ILA39_06535 [Bacteroidaceae bacterium]|nr:hypothetical protein [Bacteroidaceae bacterium]
MKDVAFLLVSKFDSIIRLENALFVSKYLITNFHAKVYFWEISEYNNGIFKKLMPAGVNYSFVEDKDPILYRTYYINKMVECVQEKYISIWDVDVVIPTEQITKAVTLLEQGYDFVLPYEFHFYDTTEEIRNIFMKEMNIEILKLYKKFMIELYRPKPVGGVFFANRKSYIECGMENENFYGWGVEDGERYLRWQSKNKKIVHVQGDLFHLTHPRGINSKMQSRDESIIKQRIFLSSYRGVRWNINF